MRYDANDRHHGKHRGHGGPKHKGDDDQYQYDEYHYDDPNDPNYYDPNYPNYYDYPKNTGDNTGDKTGELFVLFLIVLILGGGAGVVVWLKNRKTNSCTVDTDCTNNEICGVEGTCVQKNCSDKLCPAFHKCENNTCVRFGCQNNSECRNIDTSLSCKNGQCSVTQYDFSLELPQALAINVGIALGIALILLVVVSFLPNIRETLRSVLLLLLFFDLCATAFSAFVFHFANKLTIVKAADGTESVTNSNFVSEIFKIENNEDKSALMKWSFAAIVGGIVLFITVFFLYRLLAADYSFITKVQEDEEKLRKEIENFGLDKFDKQDDNVKIEVAFALSEARSLHSEGRTSGALNLFTPEDFFRVFGKNPKEELAKKSNANLSSFQRIDMLRSENPFTKLLASLQQKTVPSSMEQQLSKAIALRESNEILFKKLSRKADTWLLNFENKDSENKDNETGIATTLINFLLKKKKPATAADKLKELMKNRIKALTRELDQVERKDEGKEKKGEKQEILYIINGFKLKLAEKPEAKANNNE